MTAAASIMTVAMLARRVGITPDTVRYYERIGVLPPPPPTTAADHRRYDDTAVDRLQFIQGVQRLGLRLDDIRQLLILRASPGCPCEAAATLLRQRLDQLDEQIAQLGRLRDQLRRFVAQIPTDNCPEPEPGTWRPREEVPA